VRVKIEGLFKHFDRFKLRYSLFILMLLPAGMLLARHNEIRDPLNTLEVVTYNLDSISEVRRLKEICEAIRSKGIPDVLLMQEVHGEYAASNLAKNLGIPYFKYADYLGYKSGLAILSRNPLENIKIHYFNASRNGYGALSAEVKINNRKLLLCSLHLDRILNARRNRWAVSRITLGLLKKEILSDTIRSRSVDELIEWISGIETDNIIIGGDFNTFPLSKPIRKMTEKFNDALWPTTYYFTGTYTELDYPFKPRIDFLFHSPGIKRYRAGVIKKGPSDHYPVMALFELAVKKAEN